MNVVFWFLVLLAMAGLWFTLAPLFGQIGGFFRTIVEDAAEEIMEYPGEDREEEKE